MISTATRNCQYKREHASRFAWLNRSIPKHRILKVFEGLQSAHLTIYSNVNPMG